MRSKSKSLATAALALAAWALAPLPGDAFAGGQCDVGVCEDDAGGAGKLLGDCPSGSEPLGDPCLLEAEDQVDCRAGRLTPCPFYLSACQARPGAGCWLAELRPAPKAGDNSDTFRWHNLPAGKYEAVVVRPGTAASGGSPVPAYRMCVYPPSGGVYTTASVTVKSGPDGVSTAAIMALQVPPQPAGAWGVEVVADGLSESCVVLTPAQASVAPPLPGLAGLVPGAARAFCYPGCIENSSGAYCVSIVQVD